MGRRAAEGYLGGRRTAWICGPATPARLRLRRLHADALRRRLLSEPRRQFRHDPHPCPTDLQGLVPRHWLRIRARPDPGPVLEDRVSLLELPCREPAAQHRPYHDAADGGRPRRLPWV